MKFFEILDNFPYSKKLYEKVPLRALCIGLALVSMVFRICVHTMCYVIIHHFERYDHWMLERIRDPSNSLIDFLDISKYIVIPVDTIALLMDMLLVVAISHKNGKWIDIYLPLRLVICAFGLIYVIAALCYNYVDTRDGFIFLYDVNFLFCVHSLNQNWKAGAE
ncbi:uncharacterized protein LOC134834649 isoform X1 [Culicoides brevitarsis]|uniref:uncharacterized protein LOC134834649 isoform X1 n=1 Tax=Culicoides brevitarsis TaxID=469753 RepID=UPI00307BE2C3